MFRKLGKTMENLRFKDVEQAIYITEYDHIRIDCSCGRTLKISGDSGWTICSGDYPQFICKCGKEYGVKNMIHEGK